MYMCVCLKKHHICNEFLKYRTIHIKLLTMIIKNVIGGIGLKDMVIKEYFHILVYIL